MGGFLIGYLVAALIAAVLLASGVASCEHKKVIALEINIESAKREAARILAGEIAKNTKQAEADKVFAVNIQRDYDVKLKEILARPSNVMYAGRLRDAGGQSSSCPQTGTGPQTQLSIQQATGCELSDAAGVFLRSEADRADTAALYAQECGNYVFKPETLTP